MLYNPEWEQKIKLEPWRQTLLDAADLIEVHGHAKGVLEDKYGGLCLLGAISKAIHGVRAFRINCKVIEAADQLSHRSAKIRSCPDGRYNVVCWNNMPERTKEEVVTELRNVALS